MGNFKDSVKSTFQDISSTIFSTIRYEGDNSTFVWKHPAENFYLGAQLTVHESQQAIFMFNGKVVETFGPGRWTLTADHWPFLKDLIKYITKNDNVFHSEVYFINETVRMGLYWGTPERVRIIEPITNAPIDIGANGEMNLQVSDPCKLLTKLIGTTAGIAWDATEKDEKPLAQTLKDSFRPVIKTIVKANLAGIIKELNIDILDIDQHLEIISVALRDKVTAAFEEYGLTVPQFYVSNIALPDDNDPNFKLIKRIHAEKLRVAVETSEANVVAAHRQIELEQQTTELEKARFEAEKTRIAAQAEADKRRLEGLADAEVMAAKGYTQKDVLKADVQKEYAKGIGQFGANGAGGNGSGSIANDMMGLGIGLAAMETIKDTVVEGMKGNFSTAPSPASTPVAVVAEAPEADGWTCSCGHAGNHGKFCSECGAAKVEGWTCLSCGTKGNMGKFCHECGSAKSLTWTCPSCGATDNKGKFCAECGQKKE